MSTAALLREALLARSVPATLPPPVALQQRLYRAAISIVPPTATTLRAIGDQRMESDEALLAAFISGDAGAFETLMQRHLGWMVAWACQHLPRAEAEDAVQEAFIALIQKAAGLHLHSTLRGYLFGLLRIQVLRARRSLQRRRAEPLDYDEAGTEFPSNEPSPEMKVLARRAHDEVAAAMHQVCTLQEQEVLLFDLEDADGKIIASALDMTEGNVRVVRYRAMIKLRNALAAPADRSVPEDGHGR
jgi:RNA polymerase sigma factor (sigma-70 family)